MINEVLFNNEIMIKSLSELPSMGLFFSSFSMTTPSDSDSSEMTAGALLLEDDKMTFDPPMFISNDFDSNPQKLLLDISRSFIEVGFLPEIILYPNEETKLVLADYCSKVGINLINIDEYAASMKFMQDLDKYDDNSDWENLADEYELSDEERIEVIIQALMMFTDEEIQNMEPEFINEARDLVNLGAFPPELESEFRRKLGMDGDSK